MYNFLFNGLSFCRLSGVGVVNISFGSLSKDCGKTDNCFSHWIPPCHMFFRVSSYQCGMAGRCAVEGAGASGHPGHTGHRACAEPHRFRRRLSWWDTHANTVGNASLFLINLMILVTNLDYISICVVMFYSIFNGLSFPSPIQLQLCNYYNLITVWFPTGRTLSEHVLPSCWVKIFRGEKGIKGFFFF